MISVFVTKIANGNQNQCLHMCVMATALTLALMFIQDSIPVEPAFFLHFDYTICKTKKRDLIPNPLL